MPMFLCLSFKRLTYLLPDADGRTQRIGDSPQTERLWLGKMIGLVDSLCFIQDPSALMRSTSTFTTWDSASLSERANDNTRSKDRGLVDEQRSEKSGGWRPRVATLISSLLKSENMSAERAEGRRMEAWHDRYLRDPNVPRGRSEPPKAQGGELIWTENAARGDEVARNEAGISRVLREVDQRLKQRV